jgi:hypothetical protein
MSTGSFPNIEPEFTSRESALKPQEQPKSLQRFKPAPTPLYTRTMDNERMFSRGQSCPAIVDCRIASRAGRVRLCTGSS